MGGRLNKRDASIKGDPQPYIRTFLKEINVYVAGVVVALSISHGLLFWFSLNDGIFQATITRFLPSSIADNYVGDSYPQTLASAIRNIKLLLPT